MNTSEAAQAIGTTPRELRQFLRSPSSSFRPVGSGARYAFQDSDLPGLQKQFEGWKKPPVKRTRKPSAPRPAKRSVPRTIRDGLTPEERQLRRDAEVWAEEETLRNGMPLILPDIRNPNVVRRVREDARRAENRLNDLLLARGMHITQRGDR